MAERQFGPYRLIRQIAVGGMAEIHLAKTAGIAGFEKYVALKMIHPNFAEDDQFIQMLVDEAKIAVQLTHGNIAQTFDLGRVGDTYYITMEYVDGADLYKILRRASEQDIDMPLDICAFIGKEISSALDHAHRKRDHVGKSLGIVHRDVSPQNVLVSYSGEVKLVDFGIAKATMKARQTAVGVIKGKYYYMSPEQAWGDPIDHRSDIFSAGIVLYEMITGQMLYLEEDLHKLLEMARSAEIAPPSKLRRGVPPQLERIVMHALAKVPGERYQSAADFATDLERFLHAYSPVFTAPKLSALLRKVIGDPQQVPDDPDFQSIEFRDGAMSTHPLDDAEVARATDREAMRDENSVIFRMSELEKRSRAEASSTAPPLRAPPPIAPPRKPAVPLRPSPSAPLPKLAPRVTRATDAVAVRPQPLPVATSRPVVPAKIPHIAKPRQLNEETRQLAQAAPVNPAYDDGSGLLLPDGRKLPWETTATDPGEFSVDDLDNIGERTQVSALPGMTGFMTDDDGPIEATLVTGIPTGLGFGDGAEAAANGAAAGAAIDRREESAVRSLAMEHPTLRARPKGNSSQPPVPPAAFSANIHAPAVSELRKPRASRRTPPGGSPSPSSVLQAIVASQTSEAMPAPRPPPPPLHPPPPMSPLIPTAPHTPPEPYAPFPSGTPGSHGPYTDGSGRSLGVPTTPGLPPPPPAAPPPPLTAFPPYQAMQNLPPGYAPDPMAQQGYPPMPPNGMYLQRPPELTMTGQLRLYEVDELPPQFQLGAARRRWFTYVASGVAAVTVAAVATFLIVRALRDTTPAPVSVRVDSVPANAAVLFDGTMLPHRTPLTIPGAPAGGHHTIRVELAHYEPYEEQIDMPHQGGEIVVMATLKAVADKILIESVPSNAEIRIDGALRGRTPATISDIDRDSAKLLELRLKDYQPYQKSLQDVTWPPDGRLKIYAKLVR